MDVVLAANVACGARGMPPTGKSLGRASTQKFGVAAVDMDNVNIRNKALTIQRRESRRFGVCPLGTVAAAAVMAKVLPGVATATTAGIQNGSEDAMVLSRDHLARVHQYLGMVRSSATIVHSIYHYIWKGRQMQ